MEGEEDEGGTFGDGGHGSSEHVDRALVLHLLWLYTTSPLRSLWQQPTFRLVADDHTKSGPATVMAMASKTADGSEDSSLLSKLDELVPAPLAQFDAFPKLPETYKTHSESRGFLTLFVAFLAFLLILNDLGEFIWGWPDYEFGVDKMPSATLDINVDMVVNMPCQCESSLYHFFSLYVFPAQERPSMSHRLSGDSR